MLLFSYFSDTRTVEGARRGARAPPRRVFCTCARADTARPRPGRHCLAAALLNVLLFASAGFFNVVHPLIPAARRPGHESAFALVLAVDWLSLTTTSLAALANVVGVATAGGKGAEAGVATFFGTAHVAIMTRWTTLGAPCRLMILPEAARCLVVTAAGAAHLAAWGGGRVAAGSLAKLALRGAASALAAPFVCAAFQRPADMAAKLAHLPPGLGYVPGWCLPFVDALERAALALSAATAPDVSLNFVSLFAPSLAAVTLFLADSRTLDVATSALHRASRERELNSLPSLSYLRLTHALTVARTFLALTAAALLTGGASRTLFSRDTLAGLIEGRSGGGEADGVRSQRRAALAEALRPAVSEHDVVVGACDALRRLLPGSSAQAVASLVDGELCHLEVWAADERAQQPLRLALSAPLFGSPPTTSVAFVCHPEARGGARGGIVADSSDWPDGLASFDDWNAAKQGGATAAQAVTAPLVAGASVLGFVTLLFSPVGAFGPPHRDILLDFVEPVADALLACRLRAAAALRSPSGDFGYPPHLVSRLQTSLKEQHDAGATSPYGGPHHASGGSAGGGSGGVREPGGDPISDLANSSSEPDDERPADAYASVTVLLADVVGWTALSASLPPSASLRLLDRLWQRFDTLATAHGVYKVDTVGNAWLAVGGMLPQRGDHARACLLLALDLHAVAAQVELPDGAPLRLRIGLATGPITTGTVGAVRARFTVFGEPVAVAARMEATARPGHVQMASSCYSCCGLPPDALPSGSVDVRGRGLVLTYSVDAASPDAARLRTLFGGPGGGGPSEQDMAAFASDAASAKRSTTYKPNGAPRAPSLPPPSGFGNIHAVGSIGGGGGPPSMVGSDTGSEAGDGYDVAHAPEQEEAATAGMDGAAYARARTFFFLYLCLAMSPTLAYTAAGWRHRTRFLLPSLVTAVSFIGLVVLFTSREMLPPVVRRGMHRRWPLACIVVHALAVANITVTLLDDFLEATPELGTRAALRAYFWHIHFGLTGLINWMLSQQAARTAFMPEAARCAVFAAAAAWTASQAGVLSPAFGAELLCLSVLACCANTVAHAAFTQPSDVVTQLLADTETCPAALRGLRDALVVAGDAVRAHLFATAPPLDAHAAVTLGFFSCAMAYRLFLSGHALSLPAAARELTQACVVVLASSAVTKLRPTSLAQLRADNADEAAAARARVLGSLRERLATTNVEAEMLRAGCDALAGLFPSALACALASFADGSEGAAMAALACYGARSDKAALARALPASVGTHPTSSVGRALAAAAAVDSRSLDGGIDSCSDWAAARDGGLRTAAAVTVPLAAGRVTIGFAQLHFAGAGERVEWGARLAAVRELADAVGAAVFVRRALAVARDAHLPLGGKRTRGASADRSGALPPPGSAPQLPPAPDGGAFSAEDAARLGALDEAALEDRAVLGTWALDAWALEDADLERLLCAMMHALNLFRSLRISPKRFEAFVAETATHYTARRRRVNARAPSPPSTHAPAQDNPFHCWRHAFTVTHAAWSAWGCAMFRRSVVLRLTLPPPHPPAVFLMRESFVQRRMLTDLDCLALMLSAIAHDAEHPGTTNQFQVATQSALAIRYNDISVLENHHSAVAGQLIEDTELLEGMPPQDRKTLRKLMVAAILATDMSIHKELLAKASRLFSGDGPMTTFERRSLLVSYLLHTAVRARGCACVAFMARQSLCLLIVTAPPPTLPFFRTCATRCSPPRCRTAWRATCPASSRSRRGASAAPPSPSPSCSPPPPPRSPKRSWGSSTSSCGRCTRPSPPPRPCWARSACSWWRRRAPRGRRCSRRTPKSGGGPRAGTTCCGSDARDGGAAMGRHNIEEPHNIDVRLLSLQVERMACAKREAERAERLPPSFSSFVVTSYVVARYISCTLHRIPALKKFSSKLSDSRRFAISFHPDPPHSLRKVLRRDKVPPPPAAAVSCPLCVARVYRTGWEASTTPQERWSNQLAGSQSRFWMPTPTGSRCFPLSVRAVGRRPCCCRGGGRVGGKLGAGPSRVSGTPPPLVAHAGHADPDVWEMYKKAEASFWTGAAREGG